MKASPRGVQAVDFGHSRAPWTNATETNMPKLTLISHDLCPYVQRAVIALTEKGVPFDRVYIDLAAKPDWFLAVSPLGKVPLLQVGDEVIFESAVILEYLEETQPSRSIPPIRSRARAPGDGSSSAPPSCPTSGALDRADARRGGGQDRGLDAKFARLNATRRRSLVRGRKIRPGRRGVRAGVPLFRLVRAILDHGVFAGKPKVAAWRAALAARPSIRDAVVADYPQRLERFVANHNGYLAALPRKRAA